MTIQSNKMQLFVSAAAMLSALYFHSFTFTFIVHCNNRVVSLRIWKYKSRNLMIFIGHILGSQHQIRLVTTH